MEEIAGCSGGDLEFASDVRVRPRKGVIVIDLVACGDAGSDWALDCVAVL